MYIRTLLAFGAAALSATSSAEDAGAAPQFSLAFSPSERDLPVAEGFPFTVQVDCLLETEGDPSGTGGAQGYSISLSSSGAPISDITTADTVSADAFSDPAGRRLGGFEKSELTAGGAPGSPCQGRRGAISVVVLSQNPRLTLPVGTTETIARLTLSGVVRDRECEEISVFYVDGCQGSLGPVENRVTWSGNTLRPALSDSAQIRACRAAVQPCPDPSPCPRAGAPLQLILQDENVFVSDELFAGMVETPDPAKPGQFTQVVRRGETGSATLYVGMVAQLSELGVGGVQAYSLSVAVRGDLRIREAFERGTISAPTSQGGLIDGGFTKSEIVHPHTPVLGPDAVQGQGAVFFIVLSFPVQPPLLVDGTATVFGLTVEAAAPQGDEPIRGRICCLDGLRGSGQPVNNVATVNGNSRTFECCQSAVISFVPPPSSDFIRCDPNNDRRSDLADAVWIVNELFRGGPRTACPAAADCNGSGSEDLSDAIYALDYFFRDGAPPPPPFPDCGAPEPPLEDVAELCPARTTVCG
jgi:hypothetical protein